MERLECFSKVQSSDGTIVQCNGPVRWRFYVDTCPGIQYEDFQVHSCAKHSEEWKAAIKLSAANMSSHRLVNRIVRTEEYKM